MSLYQEIWEEDVLKGLKTCAIPMIPLMTINSLLMTDLLMMTRITIPLTTINDFGRFLF